MVLPLYDQSEERARRHLDSCQFQTYLYARPPRVQCPSHGVPQLTLPWAEVRSRFTMLFERLAVDLYAWTEAREPPDCRRIAGSDEESRAERQ